ncbi:1-deoxy-D-xylulose-5-phosphate reductoisomerase [Roseomonas haemaphysalidis]|uniref:1-deoxy-D-xylulose 5-phosphate reductoisomerase n=1 Tax=Roseomonas haemaphysalidis TaxID=2768162 RepID=A0ABS3KRZ9_9PROT|nr:1-deoxy-D-xylulose-5-phosphate reductoisomerase [Roseomonas haemaphysalidis]MBO1080248.1 1-deoxy-D-xylulose-5-phosphate reductoisomerase [Roseomonas haemaphysalidis]
MAVKTVSILGCTGSVGRSTVALLDAASPGEFEVVALVAGRDVAGLAEQARRLRPQVAVLADPSAAPALEAALAGSGIAHACGPEAVLAAARLPAAWTMAAIVGAAGLEPTLAALSRGGTLALANKEALVCAGHLVLAEAAASGATILPVDSEHNAIFQALDARDPSVVEKIVLTASGGPFRLFTPEQMAAVTVEQALKHPVWSMGSKISIDSATMMNKGLELIEAARIFAMPEERIEVLVHPQSTVHGMVQYADGSVLAQLGSPDMRTPIAHALAWPRRMAVGVPRLDLVTLGRLEFYAPDTRRFPALRLAREALRAGPGATTILNAANEAAVGLFLQRRLGFLGIAEVVEETLSALGSPAVPDLKAVLALDAAARQDATARAARRAA